MSGCVGNIQGVSKKGPIFFTSMNAFTDWAEILHTFNIIYFNGFGVTLIFARRAVKRAQAALPREDRSFLLKQNAIAQCCAINIALLDSKHQLHSLFDIVFSKKAWVSSKRCGNRKVGVPPASSARLAKISVTPKPLNESTWNFIQEWIINYIKCMQNFSSIGKRIHARKKNWPFFLTHPVWYAQHNWSYIELSCLRKLTWHTILNKIFNRNFFEFLMEFPEFSLKVRNLTVTVKINQ